MALLQCQVEKLVFGGAGLGRLQGKVIFIPGALPGEVVEIELQKQRKDFSEARLIQVLEGAPERITPQEAHFHCCSPWQILAPEAEAYWKRQIVLDTLQQQTVLRQNDLQVSEMGPRLGYRNRLEFHFSQVSNRLRLALYEPASRNPIPVESCQLGLPTLQRVSQELNLLLDDAQLRPKEMGRLVLRGNRTGQVVALLQLNPDAMKRLTSHQRHWPKLNFQFIPYSKSFPKEALFQSELFELLANSRIHYGGLGFFQINPFCLELIMPVLCEWIAGENLLDLYGGVGTLSVPHAKQIQSCVIVEENHDAIYFALRNTKEIPHFQVISSKVQQALEQIGKQQTVLLNPPRAGIANQARQQLLKVKPKRLVYLSCNVSTCARDLKDLQDYYVLKWQQAFNFFPATPHVELLTILERKK
jgi:23S rRNA (uracil1939-C5)-methyltransferase